MEESAHIAANTTSVHTDEDTGASTPTNDSRPPKPPTVGDLRRERKRLWDERERSVYHVGGLAVDLRRRGIEDIELVSQRADGVLAIDERLNEIDAQLTQLDARRRGGNALPAAGYCMSCGAPFQHEAVFCFRCGARVHPHGPEPDDALATDQPTGVIDGLEPRP